VTQLRYTRRAEADLDSIVAYTLGRWGLDQAHRYLDLIACCESAAADVSLGRVHHPRPEYLRTELGKHVVFFRRDESGATLIVRILHQRMLPELHLTEAPEE
jgi:toxin ParE1/3/4